MQFGGVIGADSPDPGEATRQQVQALGIGVAGLVAQPHVEDVGTLGLMSSQRTDDTGTHLVQATVSRSYTLWRNTADRADPVNLRALTPDERRSLDAAPIADRPGWMLRLIERMRYPFLWEAVQTHWTQGGGDASLAEQLVAHVAYVLDNRYRDQHDLPSVDVRAVQPSSVLVDGVEREGSMLDTDPFVLGLAVTLDAERTMTAVLPRDDLPLLHVAFTAAAAL